MSMLKRNWGEDDVSRKLGYFSMIKGIISGAVITFMLMATTAAGPLDEGYAAYERLDWDSAAKHFRPLAEQGDAGAQAMLGHLYFLGLSPVKNYIEHYSGRGRPKDYVLGYMWLLLAAAAGDYEAIDVAPIYAKRLTPEQIAEAQRMAREWRPK
jgi:TPR repeat protein